MCVSMASVHIVIECNLFYFVSTNFKSSLQCVWPVDRVIVMITSKHSFVHDPPIKRTVCCREVLGSTLACAKLQHSCFQIIHAYIFGMLYIMYAHYICNSEMQQTIFPMGICSNVLFGNISIFNVHLMYVSMSTDSIIIYMMTICDKRLFMDKNTLTKLNWLSYDQQYNEVLQTCFF